jgi:hypothetical protein
MERQHNITFDFIIDHYPKIPSFIRWDFGVYILLT